MRDAMDAAATRTIIRADVRRGCVRRNRVVLAPLGWRQVCEVMISRATVTNKSRTPGRARIKRKTIAQGRPDIRLNLVWGVSCQEGVVCWRRSLARRRGAVKAGRRPPPEAARQ